MASPANPAGINGPRPGGRAGRLRNTVTNRMSKQSTPYPSNLRPGTGTLFRKPVGATPPPPVPAIVTPRTSTGVVPLGHDLAVQAEKGDQQAFAMLQQQLAQAGTRNSQALLAMQQLMAQQLQAMQSGLKRGPTKTSGPLPKGGDARANMSLGKALAAQYGWTGGEWRALKELWNKESGWRTEAANSKSSARGIPQAMMSLHFGPNWQTSKEARRFLRNPRRQILWGLEYIKGRYGRPSVALEGWGGGNFDGQLGY